MWRGGSGGGKVWGRGLGPKRAGRKPGSLAGRERKEWGRLRGGARKVENKAEDRIFGMKVCDGRIEEMEKKNTRVIRRNDGSRKAIRISTKLPSVRTK